MRSRTCSIPLCCVVFFSAYSAAQAGPGGKLAPVVATPVTENVDSGVSGTGSILPPPPAASLSTDQLEYVPGETVGILGTGFVAGESLTLSITHGSGICTCGRGAHQPWTVMPDANGSFQTNWTVSPYTTETLFLLSAASGGSRGSTNAPIRVNLTGAIWTTDQCGNTVNGNIYAACEPPDPLTCEPKSPFLNGGPHNQNCGFAGGLPDDDYYFQVTDPSGSVLLSSDSILDRQFHVVCGVITEYANFPGSIDSHVVGTGFCPAHDACPASITVALWPFDPTPNPGGEYKTWVTRVSDYDLSNPLANFGFRESESKTDNFKCGIGACCLSCLEDPDSFLGECRDHVTASACAALGGQFQGEGTVCDGATCGSCSIACTIGCPPDVTVECGDPTDPGSTGTAVCHPNAPLADCESSHSDAFTAACGTTGTITRTWTCTDMFLDPPLVTSCDQYITIVDTHAPTVHCPPDHGPVNAEPGSCCSHVTFEVTATDVCDQSVTPHCDHNSGDCFPVGDTLVTCTATDACDNTAESCSFHVTVLGTICGKKFYDANADGMDNDGQVVAGWEIQLKIGEDIIDSTLTGADGTYCFNVVPGSYAVCEVLPSNPPIGGWFATTPTCVDVSVTSTECRGVANFGNYCLVISPQPCPVRTLRG